MDCSGFPLFNSWADDARVLTINLEERVLHPLFLGSYPFFFSFHSAMIFRVALLRISTIMMCLSADCFHVVPLNFPKVSYSSAGLSIFAAVFIVLLL